MSITNKSTACLDLEKQYHIDLGKGDVGEYVLLPGDPARSDIVAKYLDDAVLVGNKREHRSFTGYYKGVKVSVTSTGMGCPSTAIAVEELAILAQKTSFVSVPVLPLTQKSTLVISSSTLRL